MAQIPSFFKTRNPRRFEYKPLVYDEIKDDIEHRTNRIKREIRLEGTEEGAREISFAKEWRDKRQGHTKRSNSRIFLIAGLLAVIAYLLLFR